MTAMYMVFVQGPAMSKQKKTFLPAIWVSAFCLLVCGGQTIATTALLGENGVNAAAVQALGEKGQGIRVGLMSADNIQKTHEAFKDSSGNSHAFCYDYTGEGVSTPSAHDTWVAGIVCSRGGAGHRDDIGIAPEADIYSAKLWRGIKGPDDANKTTSFAYVAGACDSLVNTCHCRVIVTGVAFPDGKNQHPDGESDMSLLYDYYAFAHNIVFALASGKGFKAPTVFGDSYNGITAGGLMLTPDGVYGQVGPGSNSGPTLDGRHKPDVTSPAAMMTVPNAGSDVAWYTWPHNDGATSFAAPGVAGVAALLLGLADKTPEPNDDRNVVIKAVIINSADTGILDKMGRPTDPNGGVMVWHPDRGFGRIDAVRSYNTLKAGRIKKDAVASPAKGWAYDSLAPGQEHRYRILCDKKGRLRVTLVWNRQVVWDDRRSIGFIDPGELKGFLPKLKIEVLGPSGKALRVPEGSGPSPKDNTIVIVSSVVEPGEYVVQVWNTESYGLAVPYGCAIELRD
jgi:hypothetical protein